mmetsp:Transcript_12282/g.45508  ORF Transcript_12282/g.45508 Transcript_12282/m.45508 type:complete len:365 (-) Transcript_12282:137-1231(-)
MDVEQEYFKKNQCDEQQSPEDRQKEEEIAEELKSVGAPFWVLRIGNQPLRCWRQTQPRCTWSLRRGKELPEGLLVRRRRQVSVNWSDQHGLDLATADREGERSNHASACTYHTPSKPSPEREIQHKNRPCTEVWKEEERILKRRREEGDDSDSDSDVEEDEEGYKMKWRSSDPDGSGKAEESVEYFYVDDGIRTYVTEDYTPYHRVDGYIIRETKSAPNGAPNGAPPDAADGETSSMKPSEELPKSASEASRTPDAQRYPQSAPTKRSAEETQGGSTAKRRKPERHRNGETASSGPRVFQPKPFPAPQPTARSHRIAPMPWRAEQEWSRSSVEAARDPDSFADRRAATRYDRPPSQYPWSKRYG